jgi:DNA uptake protein ComE-like DNA-binding protein
MKKVKYWLRNVFGFSGREISGFGTLTIVLVLAIASPFFVGLLYSNKQPDNTADIRKLDSLKTQLADSTTKSSTIPSDAPSKPDNVPVNSFNPNELSVEQWKNIGIQQAIAQRIINYRQKGGTFRTKSDLLKIYGFPADIYAHLKPFILLPDSLTYTKKEYSTTPYSKVEKRATPEAKPEKEVVSFDLNQADSTQLVRLKGIGPGLSKRIINYRNKLGGFYTSNQLREVYGLDSVVVEEVLKHGYIKNPILQQIPINTASVQELDAHPYITPKIANIIVDFRKQHGKYTSLENLYQIRALDKGTLHKLAPYISFE